MAYLQNTIFELSFDSFSFRQKSGLANLGPIPDEQASLCHPYTDTTKTINIFKSQIK